MSSAATSSPYTLASGVGTSAALPASLSLVHGELPLPAYLPDATLGVVRSVDSRDVRQCGIDALVMNVFHLMQKPGTSTIHALGGLHRMSAWPYPIVTDSGGFQAYSLIRQNSKFGKISDQGIRFQPESSDREYQLSPEKSVQLQLAYGSDIVICLDDCTHVNDSLSEQEISVERTVLWAARCRAEFDRILKQRRIVDSEVRPLIFGVIQGGGSLTLRKQCADRLLEIGFDGFGYGGWPLDDTGKLLDEMLEATRSYIPPAFPMHALGVGHPESIARCVAMGYQVFDSALPTRDARTGRLYTLRTNSIPDDATPGTIDFSSPWHRTLYIDDDKHIKTDRPISPGCTCATCSAYSIGYLRHLHKCGDTLYFRLATIHNLHYMAQLMTILRGSTSPAPL